MTKFYILYQGPHTGSATFQTYKDAETEEAALEWFAKWYPLASVVAKRETRKYSDAEILKVKLAQFQKVKS